MAPRRNVPKPTVSVAMDPDEDPEDYRKKRARNNLAVKKSRVKSKMKTQETLVRVNELKNENTMLEEKVNTLTKELGFLKELFLAHASNSMDSEKFQNVDIQKLLSEDIDLPAGSGHNT